MGTIQEGGGIGSSRLPADMGQEYEDFVPMSEWREADQSRLLIVYVPGFTRELLRVTMEGTNTLSIHGERQIGIISSKWSRFQKDFRIPEDCTNKGIQAKLAGGILTITLPYKTTQPRPSPPPRRSQKDIQDQQSAGKMLIPQKRQPSNTLPPPKEEGVKQTGDDQKKTLKEPTTTDHQTEPKPDKGRDQITPTSTFTTLKGTSISSRGGRRQPPDGTIENERRGEESAGDQRQKGDESLTPDKPQSAVREIAQKEEERGGTATITARGEEADGGWFKTEKYMKVLAAVQRLAQTHLDHDDRKLLANMGVAALITLAFGAYVYYTLKSSLNSSEDS